MRAKAFAHTNIALIKYWGKRQSHLNLPATGSLSLTLKAFGTETTVEIHEQDADELFLDGEKQRGLPLQKVERFLDLIRTSSQDTRKAKITSINHVPTAAGLASSASAFAALAVAAAAAYGLEDTSETTMSRLARQGSGSAARSIFGGLVHMQKGEKADGSDSFATPICNTQLDLGMLVIPCSQGPKKVSSTKGMNHTQQTSPFYESWVKSHERDIQTAKKAIAQNDFETLGETMEHSTLKMHATSLTAQPGLWYWNAETWKTLEKVKALRSKEMPFFFTMDAGPHVKILVQRQQMKTINNLLAKNLQRGQDDIWASEVGGPAFLMGPSE